MSTLKADGHLDSSHVFIRLYIYTHLARGERRETDGWLHRCCCWAGQKWLGRKKKIIILKFCARIVRDWVTFKKKKKVWSFWRLPPLSQHTKRPRPVVFNGRQKTSRLKLARTLRVSGRVSSTTRRDGTLIPPPPKKKKKSQKKKLTDLISALCQDGRTDGKKKNKSFFSFLL
jgi:hypothetical protein